MQADRGRSAKAMRRMALWVIGPLIGADASSCWRSRPVREPDWCARAGLSEVQGEGQHVGCSRFA